MKKIEDKLEKVIESVCAKVIEDDFLSEKAYAETTKALALLVDARARLQTPNHTAEAISHGVWSAAAEKAIGSSAKLAPIVTAE